MPMRSPRCTRRVRSFRIARSPKRFVTFSASMTILVLLSPLSAASRATPAGRSEEHTSELQSLMRISYAVFCLKKKKKHRRRRDTTKANEQQSYHTIQHQTNLE